MSQTFFSKQDATEKLSRLSLLGSSRGKVVVWQKGSKEKFTFEVSKFDKDRLEVVLDSKVQSFKPGTEILCNFELRGMSFFSEVTFQTSISGYSVLQFKNILYKSERRSSFRLLTYPMHEVWAEFNPEDVFEMSNVVSMKKSKTNETGLFRNFLNLVGSDDDSGKGNQKLKIRVQDVSTTGMAIHITQIEEKYFHKDLVFQNVDIKFSDETIQIPQVRVIYVVDYISNDKKNKQYKVGLHFNDLPANLDDLLGKKINALLRANDFNKDFENFIK